MPSFSSSEISSMISSKKYRVKRGDTLSGLADKFQGGGSNAPFPSAKCMNKSSLMDKIYNMNKSAFGGDKNIIFEGVDLDLKFISDCRCHFKFDKSKKEYLFTDEDRLIFALKGQHNFWDDFCKCDRTIGEYMKQTFRKMPSLSLPKSMPLPITTNSVSNHRKLMEEIKRNISDNIPTTNKIVETFFKLMKISVSNSQIQDLAIKLEKENGTCRVSANAPCSVPRDKLEQISAKCMEESYLKTPLSTAVLNDLKKGIYHVSSLDKTLFALSKDLFWKRLYTHNDDKKINEEARKGVGLSMNS
ncbi:MAG: LysM peptidoglycan-binding domain-containing protein, partial [Brevinema sp.]